MQNQPSPSRSPHFWERNALYLLIIPFILLFIARAVFDLSIREIMGSVGIYYVIFFAVLDRMGASEKRLPYIAVFILVVVVAIVERLDVPGSAAEKPDYRAIQQRYLRTASLLDDRKITRAIHDEGPRFATASEFRQAMAGRDSGVLRVWLKEQVRDDSVALADVPYEEAVGAVWAYQQQAWIEAGRSILPALWDGVVLTERANRFLRDYPGPNPPEAVTEFINGNSIDPDAEVLLALTAGNKQRLQEHAFEFFQEPQLRQVKVVRVLQALKNSEGIIESLTIERK